MKNIYETPVAEELVLASADVITLSGGADDTGTDLDWDLL